MRFLIWFWLPLPLLCGCSGKESPTESDDSGFENIPPDSEDDEPPDGDTDDSGTASPEGCADYSMTLLDGETLAPSVVRLGVKLQCDGEPVIDKSEEDFAILENELAVSSFESALSIVPTVAAFRLTTAMVLDMSGSIVDSGYLPTLQSAATTFVSRLGEDQEVAIYLFDGQAELQTLVTFTNDHEAVNESIASLDSYEVTDPGTNLNGAVISGLDILDDIARGTSEGMSDASLVVFTDGTDTSSRVSNEEAALAVASTDHSVYAVGLGEEVDSSHMDAIGVSGFYSATNIEALEGAFDRVATSIRNAASSIYILAYCSPKRAGDHTLEIQLNGTDAATTYVFNADTFESGCDPTDFVPPEFLDLDDDGFRPYDGDCDDDDPDRSPAISETCDGVDNNCDGRIDEEVLITVFPDADGDGYGRTDEAISGCDGVSGYVEDGGDCDDTNATIHPGAIELCDDIDHDCSGDPDDVPEDVVFTYYLDEDGDGFGADGTSTGMGDCVPPDGYVITDGDCNDDDGSIHPEAVEICDEVDNDCDGEVDIDPSDGSVWYFDGDGDGIGSSAESIMACDDPGSDWVLRSEIPTCDETVTIGEVLDGDCTAFTFTGMNQYWTPTSHTAFVMAWGAGGGQNYTTTGGSGGYAQGCMNTEDGRLTVVVGQGGQRSPAGRPYGGGGHGRSTHGNGGGYSGVFLGSTISQDTALIMAGGGGGGGDSNRGGAGGGLEGQASEYGSGGAGGTQTAGGNSGEPHGGIAMRGGDSTESSGGGGGGGYFGGGAGVGSSPRGEGGGGSGFIAPSVVGTLLTGDYAIPPLAEHPVRLDNAGDGAGRTSEYNGQPGLVVICPQP